MYTTSVPIVLVPAFGSTPAVVADKAFCIIHRAPVVNAAGIVQDTVLFRSQRGFVDGAGAFHPVGAYVDKAFTAEQLIAARAANSTLDSALTALTSALDALAPSLGL